LNVTSGGALTVAGHLQSGSDMSLNAPAGPFTLTASGSSVAGGNLTVQTGVSAEIDGTMTTAGNALLQIGGLLNLPSGSVINAAGTVTIHTNQAVGTPTQVNNPFIINLFGQIFGTSALVDAQGDQVLFDIGTVTANTPLTVQSDGNNDTFDVSSDAPTNLGNLNGIQGKLTLLACGGNYNRLLISDRGNSAGKNIVMTDHSITGFAAGEIDYSSVGGHFLDSAGADGILLLGSSTSSEAVAIQSTLAGSTTQIATCGGKSTYWVGSLKPTLGGILDDIQGGLVIVGSGTDSVYADDTGSTGAKLGTLTPTTLTGLGMGSSGITYSGLASLTVSLGSGGNTFTVANTAAGTTSVLNSGAGNDTVDVQATTGSTTVATGSGSDTVNVGTLAPASGGIVDDIQGMLTVMGNGAATLNIDDTGSNGAKSGTLMPTTLTGLGMGSSGIVYSGLGTLNIRLGSGVAGLSGTPIGNTFLINDINAATHTLVDGGSSNNDSLITTFAKDFNGRLDVTSFEHATMTVAGNFNGALSDLAPGHIEAVTIGGSLANTGGLLAFRT
jgi:hypothetical protein